MGLKGITMNTAPEAEPHIYAEDDAAIYQAICGPDGVFEIGQRCESQVISNNKVRVKDGVIIVGGHFARIPYGDYIDFEIANGQTGKKRNDILVAKFTTTGSGGIDMFTGEVKQGTAATDTATDPALTQGNLYEGGKIRELPLYRVKLDGLSITAVEPMFDLIPTIPTLNADLSKLNNKLNGIKITHKEYAMTLEYSGYIKENLGNMKIPDDDIEKYGTPISVCFRGGSAAPGSSYIYQDGQDWWAYASCIDGDGKLYVAFANV